MNQQHPFKWRHFESEIILLCVCWYLRYALSYPDLEEMRLHAQSILTDFLQHNRKSQHEMALRHLLGKNLIITASEKF